MSASELHIQNILETYTISEIEEMFGINVSTSNDRTKFSVNYDQISSKPSPVTNQCRGAVLLATSPLPREKSELASHVVGKTRILARPFDRFFNHGDPAAADVDWADPELAVVEKLDGTLAIVYHDGKKWCMATRSIPDADLPFDGVTTFRDLFDMALRDTTGFFTLDAFMDNSDKDLTLMFELTTPMNRVVVEYTSYALTWIGTRNRTSGREMRYSETLKALSPVTARYFPASAQHHACRTFEQVQELLTTRSATESEGVVVVDSHFRRVKIKSLAWLAANKAVSHASSTRGLMELILLERIDDVIPMLHETRRALVDTLRAGLVNLCATSDAGFKKLWAASEGNRKAFALAAQADPTLWSSAMFSMFVRPQSMREWISAQAKDGTWSSTFLDTLAARCS